MTSSLALPERASVKATTGSFAAGLGRKPSSANASPTGTSTQVTSEKVCTPACVTPTL